MDYKVLVVDDEKAIVNGLKRLIDWEELGIYEPDTALSGQEALTKLSETEYDILITDIRMESMSGLELIRTLRGQGNAIKVLVVSGYDDFTYLKQAFEVGIESYLLKPVDEEELASTLLYTINKIESEKHQQQVEQMVDSIVMDNILNTWVLTRQDSGNFLDKLLTFQIAVDLPVYTACLLRLEDTALLSQSKYANRLQIQSIFQRNALPEETVYTTFTLARDLLLIAGGKVPRTEAENTKWILTSVNEWLRSPGFGWQASLGKPVYQPLFLYQSYELAVQQLFYGVICPENQVLDWIDLQQRHAALAEQLKLPLSLLTNLLSRKALQQEEDFLHIKKALKPLELESVELRNKKIADLLYLIFSSSPLLQDRSVLQELPPEVFASVFDSPSLETQLVVIEELLQSFLAAYPQGKKQLHPLVERLLREVEENFSDNLSLKELARDYNVNPTYLGRIFKQETGLLFTQYLTDVRIRKAKELLLSTTWTSAKIAQYTGFSNPNYFANVFRKNTGVYPTHFRQEAGETAIEEN